MTARDCRRKFLRFFPDGFYARLAAKEYGFDFDYASKPNRDMIDLQSFIWVQGSDEYD